MPSILPHYLPLTASAATAYLQDGLVPESDIEQAALVALLLALGKEPVSDQVLIAAVADSLSLFSRMDTADVTRGLQSLRKRRPSGASIDSDFSLLSERGIYFAEPAQLQDGAWRAPDGGYGDYFQSKLRTMLEEREFVVSSPSVARPDRDPDDDEAAPHGNLSPSTRQVRFRGTRDQIVAASVIASAPDEWIAIDAFAGTGKTELTRILADQCSGRFIHLATSENHRAAFRLRLGGTSITSVTLWELTVQMAGMILPRVKGSAARRIRLDREPIGFDLQVDKLGLPSIGRYSPAEVLTLVLRAIRRWCAGAGGRLQPSHFRLPFGVSDPDRATLVAIARKTWDGMVARIVEGADSIVPLRLYHFAKWLDLSGAQIPLSGTLLVDEGHDLPQAWISMLQRYRDGFVFMSDPYQRIRGQPESLQAKHLSMVQSVRAGMGVMPTISQTLDIHQDRLIDEPLQGARDRVTLLRTYANRDEMPGTGLRAFGNPWTLLAEALRFRGGGAAYQVLEPTREILKGIVGDAVLLKRRGVSPKTYGVQAFRSWDELEDYLAGTGNQALARAFEQGFTAQHLDALFANETSARESICFGLVDHCKNLEFSRVTLSRCALAPARDLQGDELVRAVYLAMTRARDELWIPGDALSQLRENTRIAE